jgi:hypothetical protein
VFVSRDRWLADAPRDGILVEPDAVTGRFGGVVYRAGGGEPEHRYTDTLLRLKTALLSGETVNPVNSYW